MIAQRRVDVADLNGRAHALMRAAGALGAEELDVGGRAFAVGDRVVRAPQRPRARRRQRRPRRRRRGRPRAEELTSTSRSRRGTSRCRASTSSSRPGTARPALEHGYAITGHLAQGMTCRQTFVLATDQLSREAATSRSAAGRERNRLYVLEARRSRARTSTRPVRERRDGPRRAARCAPRRRTLATDHATDRQRRSRDVARELADAERDHGDAVSRARVGSSASGRVGIARGAARACAAHWPTRASETDAADAPRRGAAGTRSSR